MRSFAYRGEFFLVILTTFKTYYRCFNWVANYERT